MRVPELSPHRDTALFKPVNFPRITRRFQSTKQSPASALDSTPESALGSTPPDASNVFNTHHFDLFLKNGCALHIQLARKQSVEKFNNVDLGPAIEKGACDFKSLDRPTRGELLARLAELPPVELDPPPAEVIRQERDSL